MICSLPSHIYVESTGRMCVDSSLIAKRKLKQRQHRQTFANITVDNRGGGGGGYYENILVGCAHKKGGIRHGQKKRGGGVLTQKKWWC